MERQETCSREIQVAAHPKPSLACSIVRFLTGPLLDPATAAAIERVPGIPQLGRRAGNWLTKEQANDLLNAPDSNTLTGKRDRAILALLLGCGLRRAELLPLNVTDLQQRESRWVIPDLLGKGDLLRLVTVPAGVKARIELWTKSAGIKQDRVFRPVSKAGSLAGDEIRDEKVIWRIVMRYAKQTELGKLAPHDLRRTCAKLCRKAGEDLEQIQILLGHASIQTTERYLGTEQALAHAVNDGIGLELG
jgi:integrase